MLKWKQVPVTAATTVEELETILIGMAGKNRVIKYVALSSHDYRRSLRVYRDAEQFVDVPMSVLTDESPLLPMDLPLIEGQFCNIGFYNGSPGTETVVITIGYEET